MNGLLQPSFLVVCLFMAQVLFGVASAIATDDEVSREYTIKAAFVYNLPKFVEWSAGDLGSEGDPFVIGILGQNPFGDRLEKMTNNRKLQGRKIIVRQVDTVDQVREVAVLFVSKSEDGKFIAMAPLLRDLPLLSVGESDQFYAKGGMVYLVLMDDKVRFRINKTATDRVRLKLSAQLQKLAVEIMK